ncbi:hypothetical protein EDC04DRAFT_2890818 [Pisolithus marmoratus]|nr:hypothetical protein EDC04DRAFT_2890818 [Pisolithus marmoratus]
MSQSTIPVFRHDYAKAEVPTMWNNKMMAIQDLLNTVPSECEDPVDSYRWLDQYDQLHYEAESIHNYMQGMHVAVPELPKAIQVLMAAADLAIMKLQLLHHEHKAQMMAPRIFMVLPSAWVLKRAAVSSGKGKQKMTQDDEDDNGADDNKDDIQGGSNDGNDRVPADLKGPCKECSGEGRGASSPAPSPTVPSQELPVTSQSWLFLGSMAPSSVQYPDHTLMPANFSPLARVNELQELFERGFSATAMGLLQDEEMLVTTEEIPAAKEESPIKVIPQEILGEVVIEWLEEIVKMNEVKVAEMHEDLA